MISTAALAKKERVLHRGSLRDSGLDPKNGPESFISSEAKAHKQFLGFSMTALRSGAGIIAKVLQLMRTEVWQKWLHHAGGIKT